MPDNRVIAVVAGQSQHTLIGDDFPEPVTFLVTQEEVPVSGAVLELRGDGIVRHVSLTTNADGRAEFIWRAVEDYTQRAEAVLTEGTAASPITTEIFGRAVYPSLDSGGE